MNKAALQKNEIYNKLLDLDEKELGSIGEYIDFMRHKKHLDDKKKVIKLKGILKNHPIDLADLKNLKKETWKHIAEESLIE